MKIGTWRKASERILGFNYPTSYQSISVTIFVKKFISDYFFANLISIVVLALALRPQESIENLIASIKIFLVS